MEGACPAGTGVDASNCASAENHGEFYGCCKAHGRRTATTNILIQDSANQLVLDENECNAIKQQ